MLQAHATVLTSTPEDGIIGTATLRGAGREDPYGVMVHKMRTDRARARIGFRTAHSVPPEAKP